VATPEGRSLPAWPVQLLSEIDDADQSAQDLVANLTTEQLNWQPQPGTWSVGQCIDHLAVASDLYLPSISHALERQSPGIAEEITPGWFGRWFIRSYIEPSPKSKRASAPRRIVPGSRVDLTVLERFSSGNRIFRDLVRRASDYDVNAIRFRNPFIPGLRFTVGTGLRILAAHQRRHFLQAARVKQSDGFPGK
jgi:hypothetical protein